jgi:hypothetical protein
MRKALRRLKQADPVLRAIVERVRPYRIRWTAHMFLLFALRRVNVVAAGDLGIRMAIRRAYRLRMLPTPSPVAQPARDGIPSAAWPVGACGAAPTTSSSRRPVLHR